MHLNLAQFVTGFVVLANGLGIFSFTARLNRVGRMFPRPPQVESTERALKIVRLALAASMLTVPAAIWAIALTAAPDMLKPLF